MCYDTLTGKLYKFVKSERKIKITFSSDSDTESSHDYVWIYYRHNNSTYRTGYTGSTALSGTNIAGASVVIPAEEFHLYWHTDSSVIKYGFKIQNISVTSDDQSAAVSSNLPTGIQNLRNLRCAIGEWPESDHPYDNNTDVIWYVRPNLSGGSYKWEEVSIDNTNLLSFSNIAYSGSSGTINDYTLTTKYTGTNGYIRIPNTVFNKGRKT